MMGTANMGAPLPSELICEPCSGDTWGAIARTDGTVAVWWHVASRPGEATWMLTAILPSWSEWIAMRGCLLHHRPTGDEGPCSYAHCYCDGAGVNGDTYTLVTPREYVVKVGEVA